MANTFNHNDKVVITDGGSVGIGTTIPDTLFTINGTSGTKSLSLINSTGGTRADFTVTENTGLILNVNEGATARSFNLQVAGTSALFANATGVGIGTTSPADKLHLVGSNGSLRLDNSSSVKSFSMTVMDSNNRFRIYDNTSSAERLTITNGGNVGIGTTSPGGLLHLEGNFESAKSLVIKGTYGTGTEYYFRTHGVNSEILAIYAGGTRSFNFRSNRVYTDLNVGIGTTSPDAELEISKAGSPVFMLTNTSAAQSWIQYVGSNDDFILRDSTDARTVFRVSGGGDTYFEGGNVGIGTTSPASTLHVAGRVTIGSIGTTAPQEPLMVKTETAAYFPGIKVENYNSEVGLYIQNLDGYNAGIGTGRYYNSGFWRSDLTSPTSVRFDQGVIRFYAQSGVTADADYVPSERMRITAAGNVGIGTTSPGSTLSVNGTNTGSVPLLDLTASGSGAWQRGVRMLNTGMSAGDSIMMSVGNRDNSKNMGQFYFYYAGNASNSNRISMGLHSVDDVFNILGTGNVGIGTTSPTQKLEVSGNIKIDSTSGNGLFFVAGTAPTGLSFYSQPGTADGTQLVSYGSAHVIIDSDSNDADTRFFTIRKNGTSFATSTELLRVTEAGNVGIGNTSPTSKLYIEGGAANWNQTTPGTSVGTIHLDPGVLTDNFGNAITFGASDSGSGANAQAGIYVRSDGSYGTRMYFATTDSYAAGSKTRMFINNNGNVGIGTTSPTHKLNVVGDNSTSIVSKFYNSNFGYATIIIANNAGSAEISSVGNNLYTGNNVGIGTTSPGEKLHVVGAIKTSRTTGATENIFIYNQQTAKWGSSTYPGVIESVGNNSLIIGSGQNVPLYLARSGAIALTIGTGGNVGIGTTSPAYKLEVSGGAISIKGNAAGNSLRFDDSGGTSRNAIYLDTSNYLNVGNSNYTGIKLYHTATAPQANGLEGNQIAEGYGTTENGKVLAEPDAWLAVRIGTTDYAIPMYTTG